MSTLLLLDKFPRTDDLVRALEEAFEEGAGVVCLARNARIVCAAVSEELAKDTLARRVAKRWMEDPSILQKLADRVGEPAESWDPPADVPDDVKSEENPRKKTSK